MFEERRRANTIGIYSLWFNWAIGSGLLIGVVVLSLVIPKTWLPLIVLMMSTTLFSVIRLNRVSEYPLCFRLPYLASRSLLWSAIIMVLINLLHIDWLFGDLEILKNANKDIPYITILIIAPVTFTVTLVNLMAKPAPWFCQDCQIRYGSVPERGFLGTIFNQEGDYQCRSLMYLSLFLTVVEWGYYFFFYINVNLNSPDKFYFVWVPVILYALSLIYLGIRYFAMWTYYCQNVEGSSLRVGSSSLLRVMIIHDDKIFLHTPNIRTDDIRSGTAKIDTPALLYVKYKKTMSEYDVEIYFNGLSGITGANLRFMYVNTNYNSECNIFHYACFIDDASEIENSRLIGDWYTLEQVETLLKTHKASMVLGSEINRIYTVAMTSKRYDREGNRLYKTKDYTPTFSLSEIKDWNLDFNDRAWLYVALNNADRPFFKIRRFWRKHVSGI